MESEKIELLSAVQELWRLLPDMRFGQLVNCVAQCARGPTVEAVYSAENFELLAACRKLIDARRRNEPAIFE